MAKMKIAQAQKIVKDSRYGAAKKKEARLILKEAKKAGKLKPKKKVKPKRRLKPTTKSKKRVKSTRAKRKITVRTKRKPTAKKRKTSTKKNSTKKLKKAKKSKITSSGKIKFYDVKNKKYVRIPRADCRVRRNPSPRGGDRLIGKYKGRKLHTFVKKGFKL